MPEMQLFGVFAKTIEFYYRKSLLKTLKNTLYGSIYGSIENFAKIAKVSMDPYMDP